jgi:hypothetical protein
MFAEKPACLKGAGEVRVTTPRVPRGEAPEPIVNLRAGRFAAGDA